MAYLGNSPVLSQQEYRNIDDISGSFNGVTTSFALLVNGVAPIPGPQTSNQCLISVNGVIQKPDDTGASGFRISGGNIVFSSAPTGGQTFFGVILAGADYIYAGENFPDGTVSAPTITFAQDLDTGFYRSGAGEVKFTANGVNTVTFSSNGLTAPNFIPSGSSVPTNGVYLPSANNVAIATNSTQRLLIDSSGQIEAVSLGSAAAPTWSFTTDPNTGIYSPGADQVAISTNGTQRVTVDTAATTSTLPVVHPLGAVGTPSITFTGDLNTGFWSPAADTVAASTGGSERLRITSAGLVGVGTGSPSTNTEINAALDTGASLGLNEGQLSIGREANSGGAIRIGYDTTNNFGFISSGRVGVSWDKLILNAGGGNVGIGTSSPAGLLHLSSTFGTTLTTGFRIDGTGTTTNNVAPISFYTQSSNWGTQHAANIACGNLSGTDGGGYLRFSTSPDGNTAPSERLRITAAGLVGIGTTSPSSILSLGGNLDFKQSSNISTTTGYLNLNPSGSLILDGGSGSTVEFRINTIEAARIDSSRRLLVGTSSSRTAISSSFPSLVQVETSAYSAYQAINNTNDPTGAWLALGKSRGTSAGGVTVVQINDELGYIGFVGADGTDVNSIAAAITAQVDGTPGNNDMPGRLVFSTTADGASSPTERMRITNNGHSKFTSNGTYVGATALYHEFTQSVGGAETLYLRNSSASPYGITISYTGASPNGALNEFLYCFDGSLRASIRSNGGLVNYQANNVNLSDINTKKDITPAADTWNCIKDWEIVNYRYKDQPDDSDLNMGVIAQQVAESCPEVITVFQEAKEATEDQPAQEERLGVKEQQMYWMAIKALQEAQVRIEQLEASNADLLARVTALESA